MKYRKKPIVVEAMVFTYPPSEKFRKFVGDSLGKISKYRHPSAIGEAEIMTLEDGHDKRVVHIATEGDYVIKGIKNEFYPCKPKIFKETYEEVKED